MNSGDYDDNPRRGRRRRSSGRRRAFRDNPFGATGKAPNWKSIAAMVVSIGVGFSVARLINDIIATRTPPGGNHPWYGDAATIRLMAKPSGLQLGAQAGILAAGVLGAYAARKYETLSYGLFGLGIGAGVNLFSMIFTNWVAPKLSAAPTGLEMNAGNRFWRMQQEPVQGVLKMGIDAQNAMGANAPGQQASLPASDSFTAPPQGESSPMRSFMPLSTRGLAGLFANQRTAASARPAPAMRPLPVRQQNLGIPPARFANGEPVARARGVASAPQRLSCATCGKDKQPIWLPERQTYGLGCACNALPQMGKFDIGPDGRPLFRRHGTQGVAGRPQQAGLGHAGIPGHLLNCLCALCQEKRVVIPPSDHVRVEAVQVTPARPPEVVAAPMAPGGPAILQPYVVQEPQYEPVLLKKGRPPKYEQITVMTDEGEPDQWGQQEVSPAVIAHKMVQSSAAPSYAPIQTTPGTPATYAPVVKCGRSHCQWAKTTSCGCSHCKWANGRHHEPPPVIVAEPPIEELVPPVEEYLPPVEEFPPPMPIEPMDTLPPTPVNPFPPGGRPPGPCPPGQVWNGMACVNVGAAPPPPVEVAPPIVEPLPPPVGDDTGTCPPGQVWNGTMCIAPIVPPARNRPRFTMGIPSGQNQKRPRSSFVNGIPMKN